MTDRPSKQSSNQSIVQPAGTSTPQLMRTNYEKSDGTFRDTGSPTYTDNGTDMEQYYQPQARFHGSSLHGQGIAAGLQVTVSSDQLGILVQPGIALDPNGFHILLLPGGQVDLSLSTAGPMPDPPVSPGTRPPVVIGDTGVTVPTNSSLSGTQYLIVQFGERLADTTPTLAIHTPWLHFVQASDLAPKDSFVALARVTCDASGKILTFALDVRQRADHHVERAQEATVSGPGVVSGLDAQITSNSAGVTIFPGVALDGTGQYISLTSGGQVEVSPTADTPGGTSQLVTVSSTGVNLPTTGLTGDKVLTLQFRETLMLVSQPLPANSQRVAPYRSFYTPWLRLLDPASVASNDPLRVILAKVTFGTGTSVGLAINLTANVRQSASLAIGGMHVLRNTSFSPTVTSRTATTQEVATIAPASNGLAVTVPNVSDTLFLNAANVQTNGSLAVTGKVNQNRLYLSGGVGWSSLSYNAYHNDANTGWVFPDPTHQAVTVEIDDSNGGGPRFQIFNTTKDNPTTWVQCFAIDGNTGNITHGNAVMGSINVGNQLIVRDGAGGSGIVISPNQTPFIQVGGVSGASGSIAVYSNSNTRSNPTCFIDGATGSITMSGSLHVSGQKNFVQKHPTDPKKEIIYASLEGGESGTYVRGTGTLVNGNAVIELPEHFRLVTHKEGLTIQLTPRGAWLQLYTVELDTAQIIVREAQGKDGEFDYLLQGVREGHEKHQPIQEKV